MSAIRHDVDNEGRVFPRQTLLLVLNAALENELFRFARQAAQSWLQEYPGDLGVQYLLAKALYLEDKREDAIAVVQNVCELDPEYADAHDLFAQLVAESHPELYLQELGSVYALGKRIQTKIALPTWGKDLALARLALQEGRMTQAESLILGVVGQDLSFPLPAVFHLKLVAQKSEAVTVYQLASVYHARWPDCLQFLYHLAEAQLGMGDDTGAVSLLQRCVSNDATGQVAERLWGSDHPYQPLWPETLEMTFDLPVPAEVSRLMGWNTLVAGAGTAAKSTVEAPVEQPMVRGEIPQPDVPAVEVTPAQPVAVAAEAEAPVETAAVVEPPLETATVAEAPAEPVNVAETPAQPAGAVKASSQSGLPSVEDLLQSQPATAAAEAAETPPPAKEKPSKKGKAGGSLRQVEKTFARLAKKLNQKELEQRDGRYPLYVIFSTRKGLADQYGEQTALAIEKEMRNLAEVMRKRPGWSSMVFFPDDKNCTKQLGIKVVDQIDPWSLKLSLKDLDEALAKMGSMIGALLIVGGAGVVPFHKLPNPTDDVDSEILSDNPYATLDTNYFVPEWMVGRLPGEAGQDAGLLLEQIRNVEQYHLSYTASVPWWQQVLNFIRQLGQYQNLLKKSKKVLAKNYSNLGYSAAVWKEASQSVFKPIGEEKSMLVSPPTTSGGFKAERITNAPLGYYNLHGLEDGSDWYGQRDLSNPDSGPDYPVALSTRDLVKNGKAPQVVYSEACYGGYLDGKKESESIALRFLAIGTLSFVGSTCIAYGSVGTPLIGADLLGNQFWKGLREGLTAGEALVQAKVDLVQEMNQRQGFLDGEDQKTLISFVLYGDPLIASTALKADAKRILRKRVHPAVKTVCDRQENTLESQRIPAAVLREVKRSVEGYLPGLEDADFIVSEGHLHCEEEGLACSTAQPDFKVAQNSASERAVVTISKQVKVAQKIHHHYARVTLNAKGQPVKVALSR
ncbi:MAG: hypothetical protein GYA59_17405 [Chloroflexi bacterium]|nr:hypothetical protein [Chloroflexota bacterium]